MHILCTICSDLLNQADSIYVTICGHLFHHHCLTQWIQRSKSCPQCRNKVTDKCMFRIYPTVSNESSGEDVTTLQSKLDDAQLQLRQQKVTCKEQEDKFNSISADLKRNEELLKSYEKKLVSRNSAVNALKDQLEYVKIQNKETHRLKEENEMLQKNIHILNGLQKVLNATSEEVEQMLQGYTDVRTIATFATALKRALCESEAKKNESRDRLHASKQQLGLEKKNVADLQAKLLQLEDKVATAERNYEALKNKRKASEALDRSASEEWQSAVKHLRTSDPFDDRMNDAVVVTDNNISLNSMVNRIEKACSPYLNLKQSSLALTALQRAPVHIIDNKIKPSEFAILNSARNAAIRNPQVENVPSNSQTKSLSIFHKKQTARIDTEDKEPDPDFNISYDGMGGHSKLDTFPVTNTRPPLKSCVPKVTTKHKLKRPNPVGSQDISKMLGKIRDK